jgi:hypothetical protein
LYCGVAAGAPGAARFSLWRQSGKDEIENIFIVKDEEYAGYYNGDNSTYFLLCYKANIDFG